MVGMNVRGYQCHGLRCDACDNLVEILDVCSRINQQRARFALDDVERLISHHLAVTLPSVGINLAEGNILALINNLLCIGHARLCHSHRTHKAQQG